MKPRTGSHICWRFYDAVSQQGFTLELTRRALAQYRRWKFSALGTCTMYSLAQNIIPGEWLVTRPDLSGKTAVGYPMTCINISHCSPTLQIIVKVKFSLCMSRMHVRCLEIEPHAPAALPSQGYSRPVTHWTAGWEGSTACLDTSLTGNETRLLG